MLARSALDQNLKIFGCSDTTTLLDVMMNSLIGGFDGRNFTFLAERISGYVNFCIS